MRAWMDQTVTYSRFDVSENFKVSELKFLLRLKDALEDVGVNLEYRHIKDEKLVRFDLSERLKP